MRPVVFEAGGGVVLRGIAQGTDADGAPLLLVHGLASNARMWAGTARELDALGHPSVSVDLRGHGTSDKPDGGYDFPTMVEDLVRVLSALAAEHGERWRRPVVAGQSMGGNLVVELAASHPGAVAAVAGVDGGMIDLPAHFPAWADCERELAPPDLTHRTPDELRAMIRAGSPDWPEEGIDAMMACFGVSDEGTVRPHLTRERHMRLLRELWERPPARRLAHLTVPMLLLPAEGGGSVAFTADKRRDVQHALDTLARGRAHWFSPADHDIHAQHPRQLAEVLHDAIADGFLA
ncbi:alpha/beta hydrolase [Baekduia soli]|uniref:Alpha/beta hydrolase n=1 Tax=Baekduia soli TaxID=496014 RepID=A0A5B8UBK1_9ACTN|nr:alpha/beta fold hydrolase [Baekduia soli]QEC50435.1 alpha/beta hydrolase [Baekduia soli]